MKRHILILLWFSLLLVGCDDGVYSSTFIFSGEHQFTASTQLPGDLFMRAGSAEFATGSHIDGSVYMVGGSLRLDGDVGGDVAILDGQVMLGPAANIAGDLRLGGGTLTQADTAVVQGETINNAIPLSLQEAQPTRGWADWLRLLSAALLLASWGGVWASRQPQPLRIISQTAVQHWLVAGAVGLLIALVLPVLLVLMAFTIVLLPLALILGGLVLLLLGAGFIAWGSQLGAWLAHRLGLPLTRGWATFAGTLLLLLLFNVPWLGGVLAGGTAVLSLGAMWLTRFGLRQYVPPAFLVQEDAASYSRPDSPPI